MRACVRVDRCDGKLICYRHCLISLLCSASTLLSSPTFEIRTASLMTRSRIIFWRGGANKVHLRVEASSRRLIVAAVCLRVYFCLSPLFPSAPS